MSTSPQESFGPALAPQLGETKESAAGDADGAATTDSGTETDAATTVPEQEGSPVLDDAGQPTPANPGEPSS